MVYRRRLFVAYFLGVSKGNATDAARRAGYPHPNKAGPRLLVNDGIRDAIEACLDRVCMEQEEILARVSDIARSSLGDFVDVTDHGYQVNLGKGKRLGRLQSLKKIKTKTRSYRHKGDDGPTIEVETEIEAKDALPALKLLGEYRGLFKDRLDVTSGGRTVIPFEVGDDSRDPGIPLPAEAAKFPDNSQ